MALSISPGGYSPSSGITEAMDTISQSNALSPQITGGSGPSIATPTVNTPALDAASLGGLGINPLTPDQVQTAFGGAYDAATAGYAPFTGGAGVKQDINQLQSVYGQIPQAYNVSGTLAAMNRANQAGLTVGTEAANTAGNKFLQSNIPGAATGVGASMIRAQSLLPALQQSFENTAQTGQYKNSAQQSALQTAAQVADQIAGLQQTYTNSLASYNSQKANFGINYAQGQVGAQQAASNALTNAQLGLTQSQLQSQTSLSQAQLAAQEQSATSLLGAQTSLATSAQQTAEQAREANLNASLSTQQMQQQAKETSQNQAITAANDLLTNPKAAPSGSWTTNNEGQLTSGQSDYQAYQNYLQGKGQATSTLANSVPAF